MSILKNRRAPLGWLAALTLVAAGFVLGVTITTGGGNGGHPRMPAAIATSESTAATPAAAGSELRSYADVAEIAMPSVVNISTDKVTRDSDWQHPFMEDPFFRRFFGEPEDRQGRERVERSLGSGVIVRDDGYIMTSNHVIEKASKIRVVFTDNEEYEAEIVGQDPKTDVALIKINAKGLPALRFGDSPSLRIGDQVMAIGNPFGVGQTVTVGIVSALGRSEVGLIDYEDFIQTDASINPGNSGGALVNMRGELIGINTAILSRSGGSQGIGFAIPSAMVQQVMQSLIEHGKVVRAWLGVQIQNLDQSLAEAHGLDKPRGVLVAEITKGAPAARSGLQEGDIIVGFNGSEVNDRGRLRNLVSLSEVGSTAKVSVLRGGKPMEFRIKLEELPQNPEVARNEEPEDSGGGEGLEGVTVRELTEQRRQMLGLEADIEGVFVADVEQTSNAYREGLREGDVITEVARQPVQGIGDFRKLVGRDKDKPVLLRVFKSDGRGGGGRIFMAIPR